MPPSRRGGASSTCTTPICRSRAGRARPATARRPGHVDLHPHRRRRPVADVHRRRRGHAENIEIRGSHVGMAVNPATVFAILDRLAQPEDDWRPFQPPLPVRPWYPRPDCVAPPPLDGPATTPPSFEPTSGAMRRRDLDSSRVLTDVVATSAVTTADRETPSSASGRAGGCCRDLRSSAGICWLDELQLQGELLEVADESPELAGVVEQRLILDELILGEDARHCPAVDLPGQKA